MEEEVLSALVTIPARKPSYPRVTPVASASLAANTWRTELDITGSGTLSSIVWSTSARINVYCRVTIDGGTPQIVGDNSGSGMVVCSAADSVAGVVLGAVRFKASLKVEVYNASTSAQNIGTGITYALQ